MTTLIPSSFSSDLSWSHGYDPLAVSYLASAFKVPSEFVVAGTTASDVAGVDFFVQVAGRAAPLRVDAKYRRGHILKGDPDLIVDTFYDKQPARILQSPPLPTDFYFHLWPLEHPPVAVLVRAERLRAWLAEWHQALKAQHTLTIGLTGGTWQTTFVAPTVSLLEEVLPHGSVYILHPTGERDRC